MSNIELLSPAGDFECLVSAVQNGANAVYFGLDKFNARVNGRNFEDEELVKAIKYAKLRNVKTHLTLNILIKNKEFEEALKYFKKAFEASKEVDICTNIVMCYINLGDKEQAKLNLDIAKKLAPDDEIVIEIDQMLNRRVK